MKKVNSNCTIEKYVAINMLILSLFFCSSITAQQNSTKTDTLKPVEQKFVPIPATGYTDENYYINLEKAKAQEEQQNKVVVPIVSPVIVDDKTRIENYIKLRDTYPVNSLEYLQIQEKITIIQSQK